MWHDFAGWSAQLLLHLLHGQLLLVALVVAFVVVFGKVDAAETCSLDLTEGGVVVRFVRPVPLALTLRPPEFRLNDLAIFAELARVLAEQVELHSRVGVAGENAVDRCEPLSGHCRSRLLLQVILKKLLLLLCVVFCLLVTV